MHAPYAEEFPVGTIVTVREGRDPEAFQAEWRHHHLLVPEQLSFAGMVARVAHVGFYHGGDLLYELEDIPGLWHEVCLRSRVSGDSE